MQIRSDEAGLTIEWTLSIVSNIGRNPLNVIKRGFVAEFDAEIELAYWEAGSAEWDWEFRSVTLPKTSYAEKFTVTPESDPELWALFKRAFEYDALSLADRIMDRINSIDEAA